MDPIRRKWVDLLGCQSTAFTHRDRLGSAATFTDHNNQVTARRHFDPFGKPRGGDWSQLDNLAANVLGAATLGNNPLDGNMDTRRGFTDHEHLDEAEIIHMNGRVYDYNVGRFMSVDPVIQSPENSQSINPYSYIMNNPLSGIDPTGYVSCEPNCVGTGSRIKQAKNQQAETAVAADNASNKVAADAHNAVHGHSDNGAQKSSFEGIQQQQLKGNMDKMGQRETNTTNEQGTNERKYASLLSEGEEKIGEMVDSIVQTVQSSEVYEDSEMLTKFVRDEGVNVLLRTGQTVGGAGQVLLGGMICYGSLGLACVAGVAIAVKGGDNIYSGLSGNQSISESFLQRVTGDKATGSLINAGLDLSTSAIGLLKAAPRVNEFGQSMRHLLRKDPVLSEASFKQASKTTLTVEAATATTTAADTLNKLVKD